MASVRLSLPPEHVELTSKDGKVHPAWRAYLQGVFLRLGGSRDNVFTALAAALAASSVTEVVASGGLQFGGQPVGGAIPIALYLYTGPVAGLPTSANAGDWAYVTDGRNSGEGAGSGTGCPVCYRATGGGMWRIPGVATAVAA